MKYAEKKDVEKIHKFHIGLNIENVHSQVFNVIDKVNSTITQEECQQSIARGKEEKIESAALSIGRAAPRKALFGKLKCDYCGTVGQEKSNIRSRCQKICDSNQEGPQGIETTKTMSWDQY